MMVARPPCAVEGRTMRRTIALLLLLAAAVPLRADEPRDVIERAVKAHGGLDNLERTAAGRMTFQGKVPQEGLNLTMTGDWLVQAPDKQKLHLHLDVGGQKLEAVMVVNGDKMWQKVDFGQQQQEQEVSDEQRREMAGMLHAARVGGLAPLLRDRKFTLEALPEAAVEGRPAVGVKASYPGQPDVSLWFDKETHLLVKTAYRSTAGQGNQGSLQETVLGDYREPGGDDERRLGQAGLKTDGPSLRAYLAKQQADPAAVEKSRALVKRLADESFEVREKAGQELVALGAPAIPALQAAAKDDDLEVAKRALACLEKIQARNNPETTRAAVRLLAVRAPDGAAEALLALLPGAEEAIADEIREALVLLAQRPGGPDPALVRALDDKDPARRDAARAALGKDGGVYLDRPGRRLLLPGVRVPYRRVMSRDGRTEIEMTVTDFRFVNRFDDKEFAKP
jgi:hypothetical protein